MLHHWWAKWLKSDDIAHDMTEPQTAVVNAALWFGVGFKTAVSLDSPNAVESYIITYDCLLGRRWLRLDMKSVSGRLKNPDMCMMKFCANGTLFAGQCREGAKEKWFIVYCLPKELLGKVVRTHKSRSSYTTFRDEEQKKRGLFISS